MTGPEHYREAEALLNGHNDLSAAERFAAAQAHATLALAAATAVLIPENGNMDIIRAWGSAGAWS